MMGDDSRFTIDIATKTNRKVPFYRDFFFAHTPLGCYQVVFFIGVFTYSVASVVIGIIKILKN